jgi:hypothetical protein
MDKGGKVEMPQRESAEIEYSVVGSDEFLRTFGVMEESLNDPHVLRFIFGNPSKVTKGVVARSGDQIVGLAGIETRETLQFASISRYVRPGERYKKGIGPQLLARALEECKRDNWPEAHIHSATKQGEESVRSFLKEHPEWEEYLKWGVERDDSHAFGHLSDRVTREDKDAKS